jgi:hypothetical protein
MFDELSISAYPARLGRMLPLPLMVANIENHTFSPAM